MYFRVPGNCPNRAPMQPLSPQQHVRLPIGLFAHFKEVNVNTRVTSIYMYSDHHPVIPYPHLISTQPPCFCNITKKQSSFCSTATMCTTPHVTDSCPLCDWAYTYPPGSFKPTEKDRCKNYRLGKECETTGVREVEQRKKLCPKCLRDPGKRTLPHRAYALRK